MEKADARASAFFSASSPVLAGMSIGILKTRTGTGIYVALFHALFSSVIPI